jgi:hypothetical protein
MGVQSDTNTPRVAVIGGGSFWDCYGKDGQRKFGQLPLVDAQ